MWVPSPLDVVNTVRHARLVLEDRILAGAHRFTSSYRDVLVLAKACGEQPATTGPPIVPWSSLAPKHGARIVAAIALAPCPAAAPPTTRTIGFILPRLRR
jgi:hypothetical protein